MFGGEVSPAVMMQNHHLQSDVFALRGRFNLTGYFVLGVIRPTLTGANRERK